MSVTHEQFAAGFKHQSFWKSLSVFDWIWAALVLAGAAYAYQHYHADIGGYEAGILFGAAVGFIGLGWYWKAFRILALVVAGLSLFGVWRFDVGAPSLAAGVTGQAIVDTIAEHDFFLRFLLAGKSATMWMSALFVGATLTYFAALFMRSEFVGKVASALTWSAAAMGLVGLLVRWRESYLIAHDVGHIPVSNLYEVFILFSIITALLYLYYEGRYRTRAMGGFVLLVISAAVAFLLWYSYARGASGIMPLIPALQSYWMKIHVPANFIGYGSFALAAMVGIIYLLRHYAEHPNRALAWVIPVLIVAAGLLIGGATHAFAVEALVDAGLISALVAGVLWVLGWLLMKERVLQAIPEQAILDDLMYKAIALGFAFFTIATVLGAMWASEAWGSYWSWDPKETWALIVWLNYAAWLHLRLSKGLRGTPMAWWAIIGLFVTLFAFLGVNMFLSGLHSYGGL